MRRASLVLLVLLAAALLPGAARGAGCSPLQCGVGAVVLDGGRALGIRPFGPAGPLRVVDLESGRTRFRLPPGLDGGGLLVHQDGSLLTWFDTARGRRVADALAPRRHVLAGVSTDGRRAVVARTQRRSTAFAVVSADAAVQRVVLGGHWEFDGLAGPTLVLLHVVARGYQVRAYDLGTHTLDPRPLRDPNEPAVIGGVPWQRLPSADGRYLFTLYLDSDGNAMVHELDLRRRAARCIDLPGSGNFALAGDYALALAPDGRTLYAAGGYGRAVVVDVGRARVVREARIPRTNIGDWPAVAAGGSTVAIAAAGTITFLDARSLRVKSVAHRVAIAIGFSPDGRTLWTLGERSRIAPVAAPAA
jgi:hypothetical protein